MMGLSLPHLILAGAVILLLFGGKGKISDIMGDFAKGIKSFKKGMSDDETAETKPSVLAEPVRPVAESLRPMGESVRTIDHRPIGSETDTRRAG